MLLLLTSIPFKKVAFPSMNTTIKGVWQTFIWGLRKVVTGQKMWIYISLYKSIHLQFYGNLQWSLRLPMWLQWPWFPSALRHLWTAVLDISGEFSTEKDISEADQQVPTFQNSLDGWKKVCRISSANTEY